MKVSKLISILAVLLLAVTAFAQTATPTQPADSTPATPVFSASTDAIAVHLNGETNPGTDISAGLAVTDSLIVETHNILVPAIDAQMYFGGARYNLSSLLAKALANTKLPQNTFLAYVHGGIGVVRNVPATGPSTANFGGFAGGGVDYDPTGSGKFTVHAVRVDYLGTGKAYGNGWAVSAGLSVALGGK